MASEFYTETGNPTSGATGSSATIRAEFAAISAGFSKLPTMAGHGDEILTVDSAGTAITSTNAAALLASVGVATTSDLALKADKASPVFSGTPQTPTPDPSDNSLTVANTAYVTTACAAVIVGGGSAPLDSPAFTGVPTAPTAAPGTNTTQLATTAYVKAADDLKANLAGAVEFTGTITFSGSIDVPTQTAGNNTTKAASTAFVSTAVAAKASLASPTFTGVPAAPTATAGTNTTQIATTAFVKAAGDLKANLASPTFTGTPAAPTAAGGTNTTQIATTAFVSSAVSAKANTASPTFTGVPAGPTAAVGTNTTQFATTAFVQAIAATLLSGYQLDAARGYIKFGSLFGGFMLAWGTGTTDGSGVGSNTFYTSFPTVCVGAICYSTSSSTSYNITTNTKTLSALGLYSRNTATHALSATVGYNYIAWGW